MARHRARKITKVLNNYQPSGPVTKRRESEVKCLTQPFSLGTRVLLHFASLELTAAALRHLFCCREILGAIRFERLKKIAQTPDDYGRMNAQENNNGPMDR